MKYYKDIDNNIYAYEFDGSQDHIIPKEYISITAAQVKEIHAAAAAKEVRELTYAQKRKAEYPPIENQLDTLYHGGYDVWKASIKRVKDKYPK